MYDRTSLLRQTNDDSRETVKVKSRAHPRESEGRRMHQKCHFSDDDEEDEEE
jgi:hypothetical protein